jgi:hypothetical protein
VQIAVQSWAPVSGSGMLRSVIESVNGTAFTETDPVRPWASSCQLRSGVSPVPKSEGPGAPSCGFWGVETEATRPDCRSVLGSGFRVGDAPERHRVGQWNGVYRDRSC